MGQWTTLKFIGQVTAIVHIAPHFGIFVYCANILLKEVAPLICVRMLGADYQRNMTLSDPFFRLAFRMKSLKKN